MWDRRHGTPWNVVLGFALLAVAGSAGAALGEEGPVPARPQPTAEQLEPGLSVLYYHNLFRQVDGLAKWVDKKQGKPGPPILSLDSSVGQGKVLTSTGRDGVGAQITGLIKLDKPGSYTFIAQSNDGIRVSVGGQFLLEDPDVHGDRYSEPGSLTVTDPGWYPISILYFERRNTSTLELYWRPPGEEGGTMPLVPAEALAHLKKN